MNGSNGSGPRTVNDGQGMNFSLRAGSIASPMLLSGFYGHFGVNSTGWNAPWPSYNAYGWQEILNVYPVITLPPPIARRSLCRCCREPLKEPKLLDCLHSFCTQCIALMVRRRGHPRTNQSLERTDRISVATILCPTCNQETAVSGGRIGVERLVPDFLERNMPGGWNRIPTQLHCELCSFTQQSVTCCTDCQCFMCTRCTQGHRNIFRFSNHQLIRSLNVVNLMHGKYRLTQCPEHEGFVLKLYCLTCSKPICGRCSHTTHQPPSRHYIRPITPYVAYQVRTRMMQLISDSFGKATQAYNASNRLKEQIQRLLHNGQTVTIEMELTIRNVAQQPSSRMMEEMKARLMRAVIKVDMDVNRLYEVCEYGGRVLQNCSDVEVMLTEWILSKQTHLLTRELASDFDSLRDLVFLGDENASIENLTPFLSNVVVTSTGGTNSEITTLTTSNNQFHDLASYSANLGDQSSSRGPHFHNPVRPIGYGLAMYSHSLMNAEHSAESAASLYFQIFQSTATSSNAVQVSSYRNDLTNFASVGEAVTAEQTVETALSAIENAVARLFSENSLPVGGNARAIMWRPENANGDLSGGHALPERLTNQTRLAELCSQLLTERRLRRMWDGQLNNPMGCCVTETDEIIVADTNNHRIQVFDASGRFIFGFGEAGQDDGEFWYPCKVALTKDLNSIVVCDHYGGGTRLQYFSRSGQFQKSASFHYVEEATGLAISEDNVVVLIDKKKKIVFCINDSHQMINWFRCTGMKEPGEVAAWDRKYYICDFKGHCVWVFSNIGVPLNQIGDPFRTPFPSGIVIMPNNAMFIMNCHSHSIQLTVFDTRGLLIQTYVHSLTSVVRCVCLGFTSQGFMVTIARNNNAVLILDLSTTSQNA